MPYLYETHLHTSQVSGCSRTTGAEHARFYKELGFQGIIVTDHFFGGNTTVPENLPWKERIDWFCSGYEDALQEGQKIGLDVFFGWEQDYGDDEYLIYGLDKKWLLNHPEVEHWNRHEQLEGVRRYGGCVMQAHPFRMRNYIRYIRLGLLYCDGIEAANAGNEAHHDAYALRYAQHFGLPMIAGSDNHWSFDGLDVSTKIMGIELERRMESIHDLVRMIRTGEKISLHVPDKRWMLSPDTPHPEVFLLDEHEELKPAALDWI